MAWRDKAIEQLAAQPGHGYRRGARPMVEPTALAAIALSTAGRPDAAAPALEWLASAQSANGSLGIDADTREPCWPTGWAFLAWQTALRCGTANAAKWSLAASRATDWILNARGRPVAQPTTADEDRRIYGHDTTLLGWPWVEGTHSWVEPTAINLLGLRSAKQSEHARFREAVKLLLDRQLPDGGWNFGNTTVFGRVLRPQVQSTGLALAALGGEPVRAKVQRSVDWLSSRLSARVTAVSLSYALLGLAAHGVRPPDADRWLRAAAEQTLAGDGSPYNLALLILAATRPWGRLATCLEATGNDVAG
ncbi:MAG: prenyltransferase/squalene oxidase repeat-containing protein [Thermoguttaceae bacterium]